MTSLVRAAFDFLLPPICSACGERLDPDDDTICKICRASFEPAGEGICPTCGRPLAHAVRRRCPHCPPPPVFFDSTRPALRYRGAFPALFHQFKYGGHYELGVPLARTTFMALREYLESDERPDVLVPVPLHFLRRFRRGFNQSQVLADELARLSGIECDAAAISRIRRTPRQALQPPKRRPLNVRGAFEVTAPERILGRHVGLVDDVLTTGSTVNECARVIREAGAQWITIIALARA